MKHSCVRGKKTLKRISTLALIFLVAYVVLLIAFRPSHNRDWELGQEQLPLFLFQGNRVTIENFRNFQWKGEGAADVRYETRGFDLDTISGVDVFISHFDAFEGLAHIFLSFRFSDGRHVVVSLETRREVGEKFSPFLGVLRQFEIIFVVGSEQDIVGLRTDIRDERVYLYQTVASPEQARALFYQIAEDVNGIFRQPRMYNTLTYNCTNALTRRVEDISEVRFPLTWKTVLPGYFDEVLYQMGLIVPAGNFAETKNQRLIDNIRVHRQSPQYESELRRITNTPES
ncbi:MAG: DUF4105 domain-containing protein [Candidatus Moranbacteria bacterium]|jgi:hypothetical protein|nr:DUF4105 domain-containing protein [Candidatus Moranbacteria bacterium]MBP9801852.1 DUF4105 domain-containing protein [Candidatus Moranbacteria bacterium]